jgi:hypothetical protein
MLTNKTHTQMKNVKTPIQVTLVEMTEIFKTINKSTFVNLVTEIKVKMVQKSRLDKTPNPYFDMVIKKNRGNYLIGNTYEDRTDKNMVKEEINPEIFEVKENWFEHVSLCVVRNKKNPEVHYLQYELFKESNVVSDYMFQGQTIDKLLFESYMSIRTEPTNQPQERKVYFQTYSMDSIKEFSINGNKYVVES